MSVFWNATNFCRCCLAEGSFKDLETTCNLNGKVETLSDLLRETFSIDQVNWQSYLGQNVYICDTCEPRLIDAAEFKRQIVDCEEKFAKYIISKDTHKDGNIDNIKIEVNDLKEESGINTDYDLSQEDDTINSLENYDHIIEDDEPLSKLKSSKSKEEREFKDDYEGENRTENNINDASSNSKTQRKQYLCEQCPKKFTYKGALEIHMNLHSGEKTFRCKLCNTSFVTNKEINSHIKIKHNTDGLYVCDVCKKKFERPWQLKKHWMVHYPDKFPCKLCGRQFVYKRGLKEHMRSHSGEKRFACTVCNISFLHHQTLKQHVYTHTGEKPHVCDVCGKGFSQRSHMRRHIVVIHNKSKPARCKICNKEFSSKSYLALHQRLHTGEKPLACDICNRSFSSPTTLRVHTRVHTGLKPYSCTFCSRQFSQSASFKLHLRIHTGERPFSCRVCNKPFADKSYLKQHLRIHTDDRPYSCEVCKRTFRESCQLKRHLRTHSAVKQYTCEVCNKQIGNLSKHMKVHAAERQFSCAVCNKRFALSSNLKMHMRVHDDKDSAILTVW